MKRRRTAPWIALVVAVVGLIGSGQFSEAGLERVIRAAWRVVTSLDDDDTPRRRGTPRPNDTAPVSGRARIIDGDTLDLGETRIRMRGIDALEHDQRCTRTGQGRYDCGQQARAALTALVGGATVTCMPDGSETYGRIVATCSVPGPDGRRVDLNAAMVRSGFAFDCTRFSDGAYAGEEREARAARDGAWAGRFDFPWDHRKRSGACGRD
jgi:endonuclease YncB( thermonuclease family)